MLLFLTFWNYATFLSVLFVYFEIGVFKWHERVGVGGAGGVGGILLFTFPHFHTMIVYFSGFKHTQANSDMQRCPSSGPLSSLSTRCDGTKAATERAVRVPLVA